MNKVTLRSKAISQGRRTLYLDIYPPVPSPDTGKLQRKYYLKIFLWDKPKNELQKFHNKETLELAQTECALRQIDVQNLSYNFLSQRMKKGDFIKFFEAEKKKRIRKSNVDNWSRAIAYFKDFAGEKVLFPQLTEAFSEDYAEYLMSGPAIGRTKIGIGTNTAVSYFAKYRATLIQAFKQRYIPFDLGRIIDSITPAETHREFLLPNELQALAETFCESAVVKLASLFSALTGLRFSDCHSLDWKEVRGFEGNYSIQFSTDKTGSAEYLPISDQAFKLLGPKDQGTVFKGLNYTLVDKVLRSWIAAAGIEKRITFHCFRHTFATLQLLYGTDIVTVSKLLGHKDIKTTMIYVKIVDKLKREASQRIQLAGNTWLMLDGGEQKDISVELSVDDVKASVQQRNLSI